MSGDSLIEAINREAVTAHIIDEAMDESEMQAAGISLIVEIFTKDDIEDAFDRFVKKERPDEKYDPPGGVFIVKKTGDTGGSDPSGPIRRACNSGGWLKGRLCSTSENVDGVKGILTTPLGEDIRVSFEPEEIPDDDLDLSKLKRALEAASNGLYHQGSIPDDIPGLCHGRAPAVNGPYTVTVYNVGSANTISITKGDRCILFDCGVRGINNAISKKILSEVRPEIVIISHWHIDHYNLLTSRDFDDSGLRLIIFPTEITDPSNTFVQLVFRLGEMHQCGVIMLPLDSVGAFDADFLRYYGFTGINLFIGINTTPAGVTYGYIDYSRQVDDSGIIVSIDAYDSDSCAILSGDCSYYSWPFRPYNLRRNLAKTSHMVIPHHGGNVLTTTTTYTHPAHADIYISTSGPDFRDISGVPNAATVTAHKTFIDTIFPDHTEHLTSHLTGDRISFTI